MNIEPQSTDHSLLKRFIQEGDQQCFSELIQRHGQMVMGVSYRILENKQDAQDCAQATFVQLALKANRLQAKQPIAPWLYTVARNKALDHLKARTRRLNHHQSRDNDEMPNYYVPRPTPAIEYESSELTASIDQAIHQLSKPYQSVIILHYLEGKTLAEIANELRCKPSAVSMRLTRAKAKLKQILSKRGVTAGSLAAITAASLQANTPALDARFAEHTCHAASQALTTASGFFGATTVIDFILRNKLLSSTAALSITTAGAIYLQQHYENTSDPSEEISIVEGSSNETSSETAIPAFDPFTLVASYGRIDDPRHQELYRYIQENLGDLDRLRNSRGETLLQAAVARGNAIGAFLLLYHGANPNVTNYKYETPLIQAMRLHGKRSELMRDMLIFKGADVNAHNSEGDTALIIAVEKKHFENAEFLIWRGAHIHPPSASHSRYPRALAESLGYTRIAEMIQTLEHPDTAEYEEVEIPTVPEFVQRALSQAANQADLATLEALLIEGFDINSSDEKGETLLHTATAVAHTEIVSYLIFEGADVSLKNQRGQTAFMASAMSFGFGWEHARYLLLLAGAGAEMHDTSGHSPLTMAASRGNVHALQMFIWAGADPYQPSAKGTAMHCGSIAGHQKIIDQLKLNGVAEEPFQSDDPVWQMHAASRAGDLETIKALLASGVEIDTPDEAGNTAMMNAIHSLNLPVADYLLDQGANPNYMNPKSTQNPLLVTSYWMSWDMHRFREKLLRKGAEPNVVDKNGISPLMRASRRTSMSQAVPQLLMFGADINLRDNEGRSALDYAVNNGRTQAADYLREMGAE